MPSSNRTASHETRASYAGWVAGTLAILGVMLVGVAFWFMYHP